jgi:hypothetical protein
MQRPGIAHVVEVRHEALVDHALAQRRVAHRPGHLDAPEHVAAHPVGAGQQQRLVVVAAAPAEIRDPRVLEKASDDRAHADAVGDLGMPGGSMHAPRTTRSMSAPACPAWMSASMIGRSVSALTLATMRAGRPSRAARGHRLDVLQDAPVQRETGASALFTRT